MKNIIGVVILGVIAVVVLGYCPIVCSAEAPIRKAEIVKTEGVVDVKASDADIWTPAEDGMQFAARDSIRTSEDSYADLLFYRPDAKDAIARVAENSIVRIDTFIDGIILDIIAGKVTFCTNKAGEDLCRFEVRTLNAVFGVEGSRGVIGYDAQSGITTSWAQVSAGYAINLDSGEYKELQSGGNQVTVSGEIIAAQTGGILEEFSDDMYRCQTDHGLCREEPARPSDDVDVSDKGTGAVDEEAIMEELEELEGSQRDH